MRVSHIALLVSLVLGTLACAGGVTDTDFVYVQPLSPPWDEMGLPIETGNVTFSRENMVIVKYEGRAVKELGETWGAVVVAQGWEATADATTEASVARSYERDGQSMNFTINDMAGTTTVSLQLLGP